MNENGNKYALAALKDRRASVAGEITATKKRLDYLTDSLRHIDGTIRLFADGLDPESIGEKKAYRRTKLFAQGELNRLILDAMRAAAKPVSTGEIVSAIVTRLGHDESAAKGMNHRVRANLQYLHRERGLVEKHGAGRETTWAIKT
jgi:hypothetical protein